jgi:uncharacterized protein (TIRG00374 family)
MRGKRLIRFSWGLVLAILFIWLVARQINSQDFRSAFSNTKPSWLVAAMIAFLIGYASRIERWRLMLNRDNPGLRWRQCAGPLLGSFAANNVLPLRAGDVLRAFAFCGRLGVSSAVVIATLLVERLLDLLMVCMLLAVALAIFGLDMIGIAGVGSTALAAVVIGILLVLLFPQMFVQIANVFGNFVSRLAPKMGLRLIDEINKIFATLMHLSNGDLMIRLVAWSFVAWFAEGCVFLFAALALASIASPAAGWLALPVGTLATLIPSTPGYVGTFDYFTVRAMTALGNDTVAATAYALLVHVLLWLPPTLVGGLYLMLNPTTPQPTTQRP